MNKELNILLKEIKELKLYYQQAKETGNVVLQEEFKEEIEEKKKRIQYLKEKEEKIKELEKRKKEIKKSNQDDGYLQEHYDKIKELEEKVKEEKRKKVLEEKKIKKQKELKRREELKLKEEEKEEERLRRKAKLKEVKFGSIGIVILLMILFILLCLKSVFPAELEGTDTVFNSTYFIVARLFTLIILVIILFFTYIQENLKNMFFLRIYGVVTLVAVFLSFGGIVYIHPYFKQYDFQKYFIVPGVLVLILMFIFGRLSYRNKLQYQYVKKYQEDYDEEDEYYDDESIESEEEEESEAQDSQGV